MNHHRLHIDTWVPLPQHAVHALSENWIPVPPSLQTSIVHQTQNQTILDGPTQIRLPRNAANHLGPIVDEFHPTLQFTCWLVSPYVCVPRQTYLRTDEPESCTVMNIVHPTLQSRVSFSPQFHHSVSKRSCRSLIIEFPLRRVREHRGVKIPSQALPIRICHCPHCPNDTPESTELHSSSKMEYLIRHTFLCQFCCVTSRQERELGLRKLRPYDIEQKKALPSVQLERGLEWLPWLEYSMAHNMREPMIPEV